MKQHKHVELIKAWADGAEIQLYEEDQWHDIHQPAWKLDEKYRVKPEIKTDFTKYFKHEFNSIVGSRFTQVFLQLSEKADLSITWDGETEKIKSVEIFK